MNTPPTFELTFDTEPPVIKKFPSLQAFDSYRVYEHKCVGRQFKAYSQAWGAEERKATRIVLARARLQAHARWRELTTGGGPQAIA